MTEQTTRPRGRPKGSKTSEPKDTTRPPRKRAAAPAKAARPKGRTVWCVEHRQRYDLTLYVCETEERAWAVAGRVVHDNRQDVKDKDLRKDLAARFAAGTTAEYKSMVHMWREWQSDELHFPEEINIHEQEVLA